MDDMGRDRAAQLLRSAMAARGMNAQDVADEADVNIDTVRDFAEGMRWARAKTRMKIETALGLEPGDFDRAARGEMAFTSAPGVDPVEAAIQQSPLSRANRAKLLGYYYDMVDSQERGAAG